MANPAKHIPFIHHVYIDEDGQTYFYHEMEDRYEEFLNEIYDKMLEICGYHYDQGTALRKLDPIAFNEGLNNYIDDMQTEYGFVEASFTIDELDAHQELVKSGKWKKAE